MTEIEQYRPRTAEVDSWSEVMPNIVILSEHIAMTEFVPVGLRGKPAAVAAAVLAGREQGIGPMTSLAHMHVVEGRPTMSAELKRARVLAAGHELVFEEMSITRCRVAGRRRGSERWTTVEWTMDDAKRANLTNKKNWQNHPRRMLQARATAELCDLLFPDVVGGLATTEEVRDDAGDYTDASNPAAPQEKPKRRTAQRKTANPTPPDETPAAPLAPPVPPVPPVPPAPEPPLPGEDGFDQPPTEPEPRPAPKPAPAAEPITQPQLRKLHTVFTAVKVADRETRLHVASIIVGRELGSSNELTKAEASTLIDTLDRVAAESDEPDVRLWALLDEIEKRREDEPIDGEIVDDEADANPLHYTPDEVAEGSS